MMMTSCAEVQYRGSLDCGLRILRAEGFMSLMKGAGVSLVRGLAGAALLATLDTSRAGYIARRLGLWASA